MSKLFIKVSEDDYLKGKKDAPITLIEYGDYECPYSQMGYRFAQMLLKNYGNHLNFVFRNFPLRKKHPHARLAAEAALSAGAMNRVASAVGEGSMAIKYVPEYLADSNT
ncbi:MAG: DsbA family protein [Gracilimonas sp.]|uniref:DsbA family protein n=1 Tax=Gracilimonas sp. TaxID=1974203 RepID=UPI003752F34E|nr:DsbA family protein [Gracilimonas sp.]